VLVGVTFWLQITNLILNLSTKNIVMCFYMEQLLPADTESEPHELIKRADLILI